MNRQITLSQVEEFALMAMHAVAGHWTFSSQRKGLTYLKKYIKGLKISDSEDIAKVIRKEFYLHIRNMLMAMRRGDIYSIQNSPAFCNWGRSNMIKLVKSYFLGGEESLDKAIEEIFHPNWELERPEPCVIGFDENAGTSRETAIIIYNAPSHEDGVEAEYWYLHYKFGKAVNDWRLKNRIVKIKDLKTNRVFDILEITLPDNSVHRMYFDITEFI